MFENLPLHPAIVHIPMAITVLLPLVTLILGFLYLRGYFDKKGLIAILILHVALAASSSVALETGEHEEDKVEKVISESFIEKHEEKAKSFMFATIGVTVVSMAIFLLPVGPLFNFGLGFILFAQLILGFLGYQVGHSGGELVYTHGAARAYTNKSLNLPQFEVQKEGSHDKKTKDDDD